MPPGIATPQQYQRRQNQPAPRHPAKLAVCTSTRLLANGPREAWAQTEYSKTKRKTVKPVQLLPHEHIFAPGCLYTFQATQLFLWMRPMLSMSFQSESEAQAAREDIGLVSHSSHFFHYLEPYAQLKKQGNHKTSIILEQCPRDLSPDIQNCQNSWNNEDSYISQLCSPTHSGGKHTLLHGSLEGSLICSLPARGNKTFPQGLEAIIHKITWPYP